MTTYRVCVSFLRFYDRDISHQIFQKVNEYPCLEIDNFNVANFAKRAKRLHLLGMPWPGSILVENKPFIRKKIIQHLVENKPYIRKNNSTL